MKQNRFVRVVASLLLLAVVFCSVHAAAEEIDLSKLTDDEISVLHDQVTKELVKRGIEKTATLPKGAYIAGVDIPAGKYMFTCLAKGEEWGSVTIYSEQGKGKQLMWEVVSAPGEGEEPETIYITLNEGDELKSGVAFSLTIMAGIVFR